MTRRLSAVAVAGLGLLTGCGSSLLGSASTGTPGATTTPTSASSTTVPLNGEVAVAFPVVACVDPANGGNAIKARSGWSPTIIVAPVPTSLVGKVTFYTDGVHTLLAPSGWTCALVAPGPSGQGPSTTTTTGFANSPTTTVAAPSSAQQPGEDAAIGTQGSSTLAIYPSVDPNPPTTGPPAPGTEGVFATWATTGSNAGVDLVCAFFPIPSWQSQSAGCSTTRPPGELTNALTPDVIAVADPAGVVGSLAASGGQITASGVVIFPQVPSAISYGSPIAVAAETCALTNAALCPTVLSDFEVREFPVPT